MTHVTHTGAYPATWLTLVNKETGTTLGLNPGESAEVDLPEGFSDPELKTDDELGDYTPPPAPPAKEEPVPPLPGGGSVFPSMTTDPSVSAI